MREQIKKYIIAFLIDLSLHSYLVLISHKVIYERMILGERFPEFNWNQPLCSLLIGLVITAMLFKTPLSVGRKAQGLLKDTGLAIFSQPHTWMIGIVILATFVAGLKITQFSLIEFFSVAGIEGARRIFADLLNPEWSILDQGLFAAIETIYMAFIATAFALPFAFLISFFASRNLMQVSRLTMFVYSMFRFIMNFCRSIEPLIWAIIFSVWVGIGPFSGMLALFIHSVVSLAKLYSEAIESVSEGPIEAMTATGAHPIQVVWFGVVPQVVLPFLSFTIYRWDINVRMATVIGLVGGGGIGTLLMQYQGLAKWREVGLLIFLIAAIVWFMDWMSSKVREAIK